MTAIRVVGAMSCAVWLAACSDATAPETTVEVPAIEILLDVSVRLRLPASQGSLPVAAGLFMTVPRGPALIAPSVVTDRARRLLEDANEILAQCGLNVVAEAVQVISVPQHLLEVHHAVAHELGHMLLDTGAHAGPHQNLMTNGAGLTTEQFAVETLTMVIPLLHAWWNDGVYFRGPLIVPDFTVPLGTTVEFRNDVPADRLEFARIVSTSVPPGGEAFDSGELAMDERFAFVPLVVGTWLFVDEVSGAGGQLVVN